MKVKVSSLKHHPKNKEIYDLSSIEELMESISEVGLLQSLIIDQHQQIISGNRRFESIKRLGWKEVEVEVKEVKKGEEELLLIHYNKQRIKSFKELINEYLSLDNLYILDCVSKIFTNGCFLVSCIYLHWIWIRCIVIENCRVR